MKIENSIKTIPAMPIGERTPATRSGPMVTGSTTPSDPNASMDSGASVQLSTQLQTIGKNLANVEVFDIARVEEIKQAISEGRFTVNPDKVADRLLETVRDLIRTRED